MRGHLIIQIVIGILENVIPKLWYPFSILLVIFVDRHRLNPAGQLLLALLLVLLVDLVTRPLNLLTTGLVLTTTINSE